MHSHISAHVSRYLEGQSGYSMRSHSPPKSRKRQVINQRRLKARGTGEALASLARPMKIYILGRHILFFAI